MFEAGGSNSFNLFKKIFEESSPERTIQFLQARSIFRSGIFYRFIHNDEAVFSFSVIPQDYIDPMDMECLGPCVKVAPEVVEYIKFSCI